MHTAKLLTDSIWFTGNLATIVSYFHFGCTIPSDQCERIVILKLTAHEIGRVPPLTLRKLWI